MSIHSKIGQSFVTRNNSDSDSNLNSNGRGQSETQTADSSYTSFARNSSVIVVDYGSQYTRLIANRIRDIGIYCEVVSHDIDESHLRHLRPKGIILSGGPSSVHDVNAPKLPNWIQQSQIPILGICYGLQLLTNESGGIVQKAAKREYGPANIIADTNSELLEGVPKRFSAWMSHSDSVIALPPHSLVLARSESGSTAAVRGRDNWWGVQFHPEVIHTQCGVKIISNFCLNICSCDPNWTVPDFIEESKRSIRKKVGRKKVLCAISGGVDSAVTAKLLHSAIGDQLICVLVDNGLLRKSEAESVMVGLRDKLGLNVELIDATGKFLDALRGVTNPEEKRHVIGATFIDVFENAVQKFGSVEFLAQGTLYSDVIESGGETGSAAIIKSHHNVAGLPSDLRFQLIEPLRYLFKDEVRRVGKELGMPEEIVNRQPFPGPGNAVRILGEVTDERLERSRIADAIIREEIENAGLGREVWQYFAVLLPLKSVGVTGDVRAYGDVVIVRAVTSEDAMTADWARLPEDVLGRISTRIVQGVPDVNRVCYDITTKPPGTIEWE